MHNDFFDTSCYLQGIRARMYRISFEQSTEHMSQRRKRCQCLTNLPAI